MSNIWVVITGQGEIAALIELLRLKPSDATALVLGSRKLAEEAAQCVDIVKWIDTNGAPAEGFASAAAEALCVAAPMATVGIATPGARAAMGKAATSLKACVVSNVITVSASDGVVCAEHSIIDGKVIESLEMPAPAFLLVDAFSVQLNQPEAAAVPAQIEEVVAKADGSVEIVSCEPVSVSQLSTAEYVVGVGRGIGDAALLNEAKKLADIMGAELSCSMPVAKEMGLLPHENYIGLSGARISPKLYLALGIAGLSQHIAGVRNSQTIVAINKDPKALFFSNADYGIVGDLNEAIPELIRALG